MNTASCTSCSVDIHTFLDAISPSVIWCGSTIEYCCCIDEVVACCL